MTFGNPPKKILSALSSSVRITIMQLLSRQSPLTFTQIMQMMDLEPSTDAGRFGYHLRGLKNANLIKGDETGYNLTELGEKVIEFIWGIIDYSRSEQIQEIPVRTSEYAIEHFDRSKITESLVKEAQVPEDLAEQISKEAEEQIMNANIKYLTAPLIREIVNSILVLKGYEQFRHNLTRLGLPPYEVTRLIKDPTQRPINSNPETLQKLVSDSIFEQYLLLNILPRDIADAHLRGDISIQNANYFITRLNSIQHDLRPFFATGYFFNQDDLAISFHPPKTLNQALTLTAKIIELSQIYASGMQSIDFFNILLAPYVRNLSAKEIKEGLLFFFQELGSTYIGPGGTLAQSTINLEFDVPDFLENTPISGRSKDIFGDYVDESQKILELLLELLSEGDPSGKPFIYPHQVFKIRSKTLSSSKLENLLFKLHEVVARWGTPIIANLSPEWQTRNANYTGMSDRLASSWKDDIELDTLRTGNLDTVFINLPRIAYESKQNDEQFFETLREKADLAIKTLKIKRNQLYSRIFEDHLLPFLNYQVQNENYFRLEYATNTIGYIGLPEAVELHVNANIFTKTGKRFAQQIHQELEAILNKTIELTGFRWVLRQATSQNWIERFFLLDNKKFHRDNASKLKKFKYYNSSNVNSDINTPISEKIRLESSFQKSLSGGHLMVIPLAKSTNSPESLSELTKKVCNDSIGLFTYAYDLTYCPQCRKTTLATPKRCPTCNTSQNIAYFNKLGAYYRPFKDLSKSERFEVAHRYKFHL